MTERRPGPETRRQTSSERVESLVRAEIRALKAYAVDAAAGMVKLDAMENPYVWDEDMRAQWLARLAEVDVNRYPDPAAEPLKRRLREADGLDDHQRVVLGNGSDELIQLLVATFNRPGATVLSVSPSFVMYRRTCIAAGAGFEEIPLQAETFALDRAAILAAVARIRPSLVFLAYPNNPTGNLFDPEALASIVRATPGLVVIDEAYAPFAGDTWLERTGDFDNLAVMRTLSKLGLAGLRLGYLVAGPAWTDALEKLRLPYNINVLTQHTAAFALERKPFFDRQAEIICRDREALYSSLAGMAGVRVWPSRANFLLFRPRFADAPSVFDGLKARKVLIKNLHGTSPLLDNCLRVTVGTAEENDTFLSALEQTLSGTG